VLPRGLQGGRGELPAWVSSGKGGGALSIGGQLKGKGDSAHATCDRFPRRTNKSGITGVTSLVRTSRNLLRAWWACHKKNRTTLKRWSKGK